MVLQQRRRSLLVVHAAQDGVRSGQRRWEGRVVVDRQHGEWEDRAGAYAAPSGLVIVNANASLALPLPSFVYPLPTSPPPAGLRLFPVTPTRAGLVRESQPPEQPPACIFDHRVALACIIVFGDGRGVLPG